MFSKRIINDELKRVFKVENHLLHLQITYLKQRDFQNTEYLYYIKNKYPGTYLPGHLYTCIIHILCHVSCRTSGGFTSPRHYP